MKALAYREGEPEDVPFVINTWVNTYRDSHAAGAPQICTGPS